MLLADSATAPLIAAGGLIFSALIAAGASVVVMRGRRTPDVQVQVVSPPAEAENAHLWKLIDEQRAALKERDARIAALEAERRRRR